MAAQRNAPDIQGYIEENKQLREENEKLRRDCNRAYREIQILRAQMEIVHLIFDNKGGKRNEP